MEEKQPQITIIGTGLMGASLGLAALQRGAASSVTGFDSDVETSRKALAIGAVQSVADNIQEAVAAADFVFIATPPAEVVETYAQLDPHIPEHCIVTDLASVKELIVAAISKYPRGRRRFVGGHPIAGSEKKGIDGADSSLFRGRTWVLTPGDGSAESFEPLGRFIGNLGARVVSVEAADHDAAIAVTSHLPQLLSSALMSFAASRDSEDLHGPAFRDMTRVAASPEDLWVAILRDNAGNVALTLKEFIERLRSLEALVSEEDWDGIHTFLAEAREAREQLSENRRAPR